MEPTLYILMRDDLASLNPGKAIAQGSHATNMFEDEIRQWESFESDRGTEIVENVKKWRDNRAFGRCLTVAVKSLDLDKLVTVSEDTSFPVGVVVDPTYPISDGDVVHHIELATCGYAFVWDSIHPGSDQYFISQLKRFPLYQ